MSDKDAREHGLIFGRGDERGDDLDEPPTASWMDGLNIPGYSPANIAFNTPPEEDVELVGEIPWELRDDPPSEPIIH